MRRNISLRVKGQKIQWDYEVYNEIIYWCLLTVKFVDRICNVLWLELEEETC